MNLNKDKYDFNDLIWVVEKLRGEGGCEWDKAQTHESLLKYLIEESYEYIEATEKNDPEAQADELGDVLLQIAMSAQIGKEKGTFDISDVTTNICKKMIYRHPHVFSDTKVSGVSDILKNWDELKKKEKNIKEEKEVLLEISKAIPPLLRAQKVVKKIKKLEKNKKIKSFNEESIDKMNKMIDNSHVLSSEFVKSDKIAEALISLIYIACENDISLDLCLTKKVDELISKFN